MARSSSSLWLDVGLLGTAALVASVSLSFAVQPLIAGAPAFPEEPPEWSAAEGPASEIFDDAARGRLSQLTALSLEPQIQITSTAPLSPLRYLVSGTLTSRNSLTAIAVLFDPQTRSGLIVRIGDLLDDAVVTAIDHRTVTVHRFGRDELLRPAGALTAIATQQQSSTIHTLAPDRVAVPRHMIDGALMNPATLMGQAMLMPSVQAGRTVFRIERIRPGSVFEQLGLQNGDTFMSINGIATDRVDVLMGSISQLPRMREVTVDFMRGGQLQRRTFSIEG